MKELVERFIRSHPENHYKIQKKENEYVLTFMQNNALHDLTVCTSYEILERKYNNLNNKTCSICFDENDVLDRCRYCGYTICINCQNEIDDFKCAQCRNEDLRFEWSIYNYDTTIHKLVKELKDECNELKEEFKDDSKFMEFIHYIMTLPNENIRTQMFNVLLNVQHCNFENL